ncbi:MAG: phosphoribosylformylglycinamidine synthase, partial [Lachnospiraceae bacterium]|nr:phosphoribosylformylglycinamidine synthase [Lachnospiraceae bacterium]
MGAVRRLYVEKKDDFQVKAKKLKSEITRYLGINSITNVRVLIRYDVQNVSDDTYKKALSTVFSEPPVDVYFEGTFPYETSDYVFSVEYLPGQFDQRADSAEQCIKLLNEKEEPIIRSAVTYVLTGSITSEEFDKIKSYCINPVDSRFTDETIPETLVMEFENPADVLVFEGFIGMDDEKLKELYTSLNLAMTFNDFKFIQDYFKNKENRDPSITEVRMLDTYWSDHCRHTTYLTELKNVEFEDGFYKEPIEKSFEEYMAIHKEMYAGRDDKYVSLMDIALLAMKKLKAMGKLDDEEESDEINACSIVVPVKVDGKEEEWLIFFKNETHNHPTEIEPFGGAATCLGGAIRDPLSGRGYVYQAMRVTGAADPTVPVKDTIPGKLPQRKIVTGAAEGY